LFASLGLVIASCVIVSTPRTASAQAQGQQNEDQLVWSSLLPSCDSQLRAAVDFQVTMQQDRANSDARLRKAPAGFANFQPDLLKASRGEYAARVASVANDPYPQVRATASYEAFRMCMYDGRLRQLANGAASQPKVPTPPNTQAARQQTQPAPVASSPAPNAFGGLLGLPGAPVIKDSPLAQMITVQPGGLSGSASIDACAREIQDAQLENQRARGAGAGPEADVTLYTHQVEMFTGKCASHPEAAAYVSNGRRFLSQAQQQADANKAANGSPQQQVANGAPKPLSTPPDRMEHNPAGEASQCIKVMRRSEFAALGVKTAVGNIGFYNSCNHNVEILWCSEGHDCNPGYSNMGTVKFGPTDQDRFSTIPLADADEEIWFAACFNGFLRTNEYSKKRMHACK
jgi:hypothetical protein